MNITDKILEINIFNIIFQEMEHIPTYEPFMVQHSTRDLAGGSQPCLFLASSDFESAQMHPDINALMQRENIQSVDVHQKDRPKTPKSRASSSQSHVSKKSKQNVDTYSMQDSNTRQMPSTPHSRKKSSSGSLKRVDSAKTESRPKQKSSSKKSDKALKRSESFTTAAREGPEQTSRDRRIRSQQGNIPEYSYNDRLDDSEIERMVLPPPPPLNIQGRGLDFNTLSSTLAIQEPDHHPLQMPPPNFTTDNIISFREQQPQSQLQTQQQTEEATSSPLAVIRRKRANQANWERSRKHESVPKATEKEPLSIAETIRRKTVFQGRR